MKKLTLFDKICLNYVPYTSMFFISNMLHKVVFYITREEDVYPLATILAGIGFAMIFLTIYRHYTESE